MKTQILADTFSDLAPGNRKGASSSPTITSTRASASQRLRGKSSERMARSMALPLGHGIEALRTPQQDQRHQQDIGAQRDLGRQEADIVGAEPHQKRADEATADRAQPADDDDD